MTVPTHLVINMISQQQMVSTPLLSIRTSLLRRMNNTIIFTMGIHDDGQTTCPKLIHNIQTSYWVVILWSSYVILSSGAAQRGLLLQPNILSL